VRLRVYLYSFIHYFILFLYTAVLHNLKIHDYRRQTQHVRASQRTGDTEVLLDRLGGAARERMRSDRDVSAAKENAGARCDFLLCNFIARGLSRSFEHCSIVKRLFTSSFLVARRAWWK
jgi:hypothetical protein